MRTPGWFALKVEASELARTDRKSTRLNSSHLGISYAVFCLKKKKKQRGGQSRGGRRREIEWEGGGDGWWTGAWGGAGRASICSGADDAVSGAGWMLCARQAA